MEAGKMDRRLTIERAQIVEDGYGNEVVTWAPLATVWAEAEPISDGERWRAAEVAADVTYRFRIRWGFGVTVEDQVTYEGRAFDIDHVKELGRREGQEITAKSRAE